MSKDIFPLIKPLTQRTVSILMDCHERELMNLEPYEASMVPSVKCLIDRKLANTKTYINKSGKKIVGLVITDLGKLYLSSVMNKQV